MPGHEPPPPPYENWMNVPDTSLLPPPPSIHYEESPLFNASRGDADRARAWTAVNRLWPPRQLLDNEADALSIGFASILRPAEFTGNIAAVRDRPGTWHITPHRKCRDSNLLSTLPLYSALMGAPLYGEKQTAYFEVRIGEMGKDAGVAIGFVAAPYPSWRLPGWERASLGVHGDDGRKYVNDNEGGVDFTHPFQPGEVVGVGMEFNANMQLTSKKDLASNTVRVFFTRQGRMERSWDLHEQADSDANGPGGVSGLEGANDLYASIGVFGASDFEIRFGRHNWLFRP